jgi:uncharacterized delta-60 repeat protein
VVGVSKGRLALARYSRDGSLDRSFGRQGTVVSDSGGLVAPGKAALDKAGRILVPVSGGCYPCPAYVVRYTADGRLDRTFGRSGRAAVELSSVDAVATFRGQIVIAGLAIRGRPRLALSRLSSAGKPDRRFGRNGTRLLPVAWAWQPDLTIQKDGRILVAAGARPRGAKGFFGDYNFTLTRLLQNGAPDRSFGRYGTVRDEFRGRDFGQTVAVQPNGRLLVAGVVGPLADGIGLARHLP